MQSVSSTDFHDAVLLPGGGRILMAYIRNPEGVLESHFEEVNAAGDVILTWNSQDHINPDQDPVTRPLGDNAHLNSIEVMLDGNLLLSFRHLSQVMKVNRTTGAVMWRLGGVNSTFAFPDDPFGGPCAQHTARELANGDIQIFDNGAKLTQFTVDKMCPNPADPKGPRIERGLSRVTVYRLDESSKEASLIDSHELDGFSQFAGSAQRLGTSTLSDNVMVGLFDGRATGTGAQMPDALEIAPDGTTVWSLSAADASSYRALAVPYRDARNPTISVEGLDDGGIYGPDDAVEVRYGCTDAGGSNLVECSATVPYGSRADMQLGPHTVTVTARDGAGNTTIRTISYQVVGPTVPPTTTPPTTVPPTTAPPTTVPPTTVPTPTTADTSIRKPDGSWKGAGITRPSRQTVTLRTVGPDRAITYVRVRNSGDTRGRLTLTGSPGNRWSTVRWFAGKRDVTARVLAGTYRTAALNSGESVRLRLVVRVSDTDQRRIRTLRLAASNRAGQGKDVVRARVIVR